MATLTNCDHLFNSLFHYVSVLASDIAGVSKATRPLKITEIVCDSEWVSEWANERMSESERVRVIESEQVGVSEWESALVGEWAGEQEWASGSEQASEWASGSERKWANGSEWVSERAGVRESERVGEWKGSEWAGVGEWEWAKVSEWVSEWGRMRQWMSVCVHLTPSSRFIACYIKMKQEFHSCEQAPRCTLI
jgi:hypothetical protein